MKHTVTLLMTSLLLGGCGQSEIDPVGSAAKESEVKNADGKRAGSFKVGEKDDRDTTGGGERPGSKSLPGGNGPVDDTVVKSVPTAAQIEDEVAQDYAKLDPSQRGAYRYVSLAGVADAHGKSKVRLARFGVEKTLNSLSKADKIAKLEQVGSSGTLFRFNIAAFGWDGGKWSTIAGGSRAGKYLKTLSSGATLVDGDWLVFSGTRPEVYRNMIGLPPTEPMLEAPLGVNRANAKYLGIRKSIVTFAGRMLERVPIRAGNRDGYYWRSYDFFVPGAADRAIDSGDISYVNGRSIPDFVASEMIWSLPNGLQAYYISGFGAQQRYDADVRVARDGRRADGIVINGESCMTCHTHGVNIRQDEVRPALASKGQAIDGNKFPTQAEISALFAGDAKIFAQAIAEMGYPDIPEEPIGPTIQMFIKRDGQPDTRTQAGEVDAVF